MATSTIPFDKNELVTACNVTCGKYLNASAVVVSWPPYYTAEIPVQEGYYICVFNSADNINTSSVFYDSSGAKVGNPIVGRGNNQKGFGQYYTVPTGAVSLKVSMYVSDRNVLSKSSYSNPDA